MGAFVRLTILIAVILTLVYIILFPIAEDLTLVEIRYIWQIGTNKNFTQSLRPVVSIDLKTDKYNLEKNVDKDGKVSFKLKEK